MPSPYTTPYVPREYDRGPTMRIADLLREGGDARARAMLQSSALWGQAIQQLGQIPGQIIEGRAMERESKARAEDRAAQTEMRRAQMAAMQAEADDKRAVGQALSAGSLEEVESILRDQGREHLIAPTRDSWLKSDEIAANRRKARREEADAYLDTAILGLGNYLNDPDGGIAAAQRLAAKAQKDGMEDAFQELNPAALQDPNVLRQEFERVRTERQKPIAGDKPLVVQQPDGSYKTVYEPEAKAPAAPNTIQEAILAARAKGDKAEEQALLQLQARYAAAGREPDKPGDTGLSPGMEANVINRLSQQWEKAVAPVAELHRQAKLMEVGLSEARKGNMPSGSQAVLVTFQKILDPTSVVRESEYARSAAGQALFARIEGAVEKLAKGGAGVPLSELEKFAELANQAVRALSSGRVDAIKERIGRTADRYKIPRDVVFEEFDFTAAPKKKVFSTDPNAGEEIP